MMKNKEIGKVFYHNDTFFFIHAYSDFLGRYISSSVREVLRRDEKTYRGIPNLFLEVEDEPQTVSLDEAIYAVKKEREKYEPMIELYKKLKRAYYPNCQYVPEDAKDPYEFKKAIRRVVSITAEKNILGEQISDPSHLSEHYFKEKEKAFKKASKGYRNALKPIHSKLSKEQFAMFLKRVEEYEEDIGLLGPAFNREGFGHFFHMEKYKKLCNMELQLITLKSQFLMKK